MKRVCIVGYGAIGPVHARALEKVKNAELYGVCDILEERRKACRDKYSVKEYDDFECMLMDSNIDTVHICTPHYLHFEMVKQALAAGKDVVVEKPVTMTKEEFQQLLLLEGNERICVVLQNRLNPSIQKLKEVVDSGVFGEVKAAKAFLTWKRDKSYYESGAWRGKWATEGGGVVINQAVHTLDYFNYLIGDVTSVKAQMCNFSLENVIEVEDTCMAMLELEQGIRGIFFATNAYSEISTPFFEVLFEGGRARYIDKQLWINGEKIVEDAKPTIGKDCWGGGHEELMRRYYDEHEYFSVEDVANTMNTVFALYDSAQGGACVEIEHNEK